MKKKFLYYGEHKSERFFTVVTDNEKADGVIGVDVCYHHFKLTEDGAIRPVSYLELSPLHTIHHHINEPPYPSIAQRVTLEQAERFHAELTTKFPILADFDEIQTHTIEEENHKAKTNGAVI